MGEVHGVVSDELGQEKTDLESLNSRLNPNIKSKGGGRDPPPPPYAPYPPREDRDGEERSDRGTQTTDEMVCHRNWRQTTTGTSGHSTVGPTSPSRRPRGESFTPRELRETSKSVRDCGSRK